MRAEASKQQQQLPGPNCVRCCLTWQAPLLELTGQCLGYLAGAKKADKLAAMAGFDLVCFI